MQKSDIRILVIEDDVSLGRAIDEGLKRAGYHTQLVGNYTQAINAAKISDFRGVVADCMLPQKSGVDIAQEIIQESAHDVVVILTSGIFKDKAFAHDAQLKTKARAFMSKPFDIEELINHFDQAFSDIVEESREPLFQLMAKDQYSTRDRIGAINHTEYVHGYDLPFVYNLLLENQIEGELEIEYDDGKPTTRIGFHKGRIDKVQFPDTESYFGALLIEKGFITPTELDAGLNKNDGKPIGQRLVENSSLSPHAVELVQHDQMVIRLSKTIQDTSVKIKFIEAQKSEPKVFVDGYLLMQLLSDWICTKIKFDWLLSFYTPWMENPVIKGPEVNKINFIKGLPAASPFAEIIIENKWPYSLQDLLSKNPAREEELLRAVHFMAVQRIIVFGPKSANAENFEIKEARLKKIFASFQGKNNFEILGVSVKARPTEVNRAYHELAKTLHPDKLQKNTPQALQDLAQQVFSRITDAYQTLNNESRRKDYQKSLDLGLADEILKSESSFEDGLRCLKTNRFRDARKIFEQTLKLKGHRSDTIIYLLWALIKEKRNRADNHELAGRVSAYLSKVPHEDRHSAQFFFVKGMYYELTGQIQKAYMHHKHSAKMDPYFMDAKREIAFIKKSYNSRKSQTLTDDLSMVVNRFFKKKSG